MKDINNIIKTFLEDELLLEFNNKTTSSTNLFESGAIDSFGFIELITFLEQKFKIKISEEEIHSNALTTFEKITELVSTKREANNE